LNATEFKPKSLQNTNLNNNAYNPYMYNNYGGIDPNQQQYMNPYFMNSNMNPNMNAQMMNPQMMNPQMMNYSKNFGVNDVNNVNSTNNNPNNLQRTSIGNNYNNNNNNTNNKTTNKDVKVQDTKVLLL